MSFVSWARLGTHTAILSWFAAALSYNNYLTASGVDTRKHTYAGKWKYLTYLNLVLQTVFFGLCVLTDAVHLCVAGGGAPGRWLLRCRDALFSVLAFPYATFVFTMFWTLYTLDRELVYPKALDAIIPPWLNHAMHTTILPLVLVQSYIQNHVYPSRRNGVAMVVLSGVLYLLGVLWVHHVSGFWVYPILAQLSPMMFVLFGLSCAGVLILLYLLGEMINNRLWRHQWAFEEKLEDKMC